MPLELALHMFAKSCGRFPWELTDADPPTDAVLRALAIEARLQQHQADRAEYERRHR